MNGSLKNCVIFYFSQVVTGNTKRIAEKIAEGIRLKHYNCELVQLKKYNMDLKVIKTFPFDKYTLIGIGVPVYYFHPPYHILFELEQFPSLHGKIGFLFCTSGGNPGSTLYQMKKILDKTGIKIIDGNDKWIGWDIHQLYARQENSNGLYGWLPSSYGHPNEFELNQAKEFGKILIKKALDPKISEKNDFWAHENESAKMWSWKGIQEWFPEFDLIKEKCTQCGLCAQICPWDAIMLNPYPSWIKDCDRCYICHLKCPENAIKCDFSKQIEYLERLMKKSEKKKI